VQRAHIERTPADVRKRLETLEGRQRSAERLARLLSQGLGGLGASGRSMLDDAHKTGELQRLVDALSETDRNAPASSSPRSDAVLTPLSREVPLINKVAAGYPSEFTDLGYPARIADEYVRVPDLSDPDAFAARVVGDSMEPEYHEGDVVIFSPQRDVRDGSDCFVRLEHDAETTFKRVYFERAPRNGGDGNEGDSGDDTASGESGEGAELIRLQPLNSRFAPRTLPREEVAGLYAAVSVTRQIG
jgi:SOS-response transcriptional repressor LexA